MDSQTWLACAPWASQESCLTIQCPLEKQIEILRLAEGVSERPQMGGPVLRSVGPQNSEKGRAMELAVYVLAATSILLLIYNVAVASQECRKAGRLRAECELYIERIVELQKQVRQAEVGIAQRDRFIAQSCRDKEFEWPDTIDA